MRVLEPVINFRAGSVANENRFRPGPPRTGPSFVGKKSEGWGQFSPFLRHSSLEDTPYSSLLAPRTEKNWLPAPPAGKLITGSRASPERLYPAAAITDWIFR